MDRANGWEGNQVSWRGTQITHYSGEILLPGLTSIQPDAALWGEAPAGERPWWSTFTTGCVRFPPRLHNSFCSQNSSKSKTLTSAGAGLQDGGVVLEVGTGAELVVSGGVWLTAQSFQISLR